MVISIAFSFYPLSFIRDLNKKEENEPDQQLEKDREGAMFNEE